MSILQHTARHCKTLQHTATHCNTLQHTATHYTTPYTQIANAGARLKGLLDELVGLNTDVYQVKILTSQLETELNTNNAVELTFEKFYKDWTVENAKEASKMFDR